VRWTIKQSIYSAEETNAADFRPLGPYEGRTRRNPEWRYQSRSRQGENYVTPPHGAKEVSHNQRHEVAPEAAGKDRSFLSRANPAVLRSLCNRSIVPLPPSRPFSPRRRRRRRRRRRPLKSLFSPSPTASSLAEEQSARRCFFAGSPIAHAPRADPSD